MTATFADSWGTLGFHGVQPSQPSSCEPQTDLWPVYGHQETLQILGDPRIFPSHARGVTTEAVKISALARTLLYATDSRIKRTPEPAKGART